jgi:hypothetical protein
VDMSFVLQVIVAYAGAIVLGGMIGAWLALW